MSLSLDHPIHYTTPKSNMTEITNITTNGDKTRGAHVSDMGSSRHQ